MGFADLFPIVVCSPIAGLVADRYDRLAIAKVIQLIAAAQAVLLTTLYFAGLVTVEVLFFLTIIAGTEQAFYQPVRQAMTPNLVRREDLAAAIAVNSVAWHSARFIGPAIAGVILVVSEPGYAFAFNAIAFSTFLIALWNIRIAAEPPAERSPSGALGDLKDGYRYAFSHPVIGPLYVILATAAVFGRPVVELLPGFSAAVFGRGPEGLAWLTSAMGLGAVLAGIWLGNRGRIAGLATHAVMAIFCTAAFLLVFTYTPMFEVAVLCMTGIGFMYVVTGTTIQTMVQTVVEPQLRGRVLALYGLIWIGGASFGALFMGTMSEWFGLRAPVAGGAVIVIVVWIWAMRVRRCVGKLVEDHAPEH
jgi:predicted MFS family arabinose efflux permease